MPPTSPQFIFSEGVYVPDLDDAWRVEQSTREERGRTGRTIVHSAHGSLSHPAADDYAAAEGGNGECFLARSLDPAITSVGTPMLMQALAEDWQARQELHGPWFRPNLYRTSLAGLGRQGQDGAEMIMASSGVYELAFSTVRNTLAALEVLPSSRAAPNAQTLIWEWDFDNGRRVFLTGLPPDSSWASTAGYSQDGQWLLLSAPEGTYLTSTVTGRRISLGAGYLACWYPSAGPSHILITSTDREANKLDLEVFDLSTGDTHNLLQLSSPTDSPFVVFYPQACADGRILCTTRAAWGSDEGWRQVGGGGVLLAIDPGSGEMDFPYPRSYANHPMAIRTHERPKWAESLPDATTHVADYLLERQEDNLTEWPPRYGVDSWYEELLSNALACASTVLDASQPDALSEAKKYADRALEVGALTDGFEFLVQAWIHGMMAEQASEKGDDPYPVGQHCRRALEFYSVAEAKGCPEALLEPTQSMRHAWADVVGE